ncbi:MAG: hypothetical protein CL910_02630 [Deltaproteobacteria bacterium]|jgi:hypothetical protein|nr:hypothetical protein [Deltaproteobacteria bacterium]
MEKEVGELILVLDELIAFLERHGEAHWQDWMGRSRRLLEARDLSGVTRLLGAYGGMGSFNDLYLCPENGHAIE